jgi:hypothetical protein
MIYPLQYEGDKNYFFISYSHQDREIVLHDLHFLEAYGYRFWYDNGLFAGQNWDEVVLQKICENNCVGVLFYLCENSKVSKAVSDELKMAIEFNKKYFSVNIGDFVFNDGIIVVDSKIEIMRYILSKFQENKIFIKRDSNPESEDHFVNLRKTLDNWNIRDVKGEEKIKGTVFDFSLPNFTREFSFFTDIDEPKDNIISSGMFLREESKKNESGIITRLVMLIKLLDGKPISKIYTKEINIYNEMKLVSRFVSEKEIDTRYNEEIKGRDYNVICVDILTTPKSLIQIMEAENVNIIKMSLSVLNILDVMHHIDYEIKLIPGNECKKENPDLNEIKDIYTRKIHYSNYKV